jgi:hypothetical protein
MSRPFLAVILLMTAACPVFGLPTAEEVKANVRRAVGFDAFRKLDLGLALEGKAEFFGLPGTFRMRLHPDGRYVRVIEAAGTHAVGYDGMTRWGRNFADPVLDLHFEEADRDRFLFGVLCHRWLASDGGFTATVDERTSRSYRLELVLAHPDAGVTARLVVDPSTWLPETLTVPGGSRARLFNFADYRSVSGVVIPTVIGQDRYAGGQWVAAERAGPATAGAEPFTRPVVRGGLVFDPTIPAKVESRKGPGGMLLVRPRIDEKVTPWFVLDTGNGGQTVLAAEFAHRLGLPAAGGLTLAGVGGTARSRFRTAKQFSLGPAAVETPTLADCPDGLAKALSDAAGVEVAGFVGRDFLARVVVELDHAAGSVAVHDPSAYRLPPGGVWEPIRFNSRTPCIRAVIDGKHSGWVAYDSGFEAPFVFHLHTVHRSKLLEGRETTPHSIYGVGGSEDVREGAGGELRAFGRVSRLARTFYAIDRSGGHTDPYTMGTFGTSALGRGVVVLDYPNSRIGFVPQP